MNLDEANENAHTIKNMKIVSKERINAMNLLVWLRTFWG